MSVVSVNRKNISIYLPLLPTGRLTDHYRKAHVKYAGERGRGTRMLVILAPRGEEMGREATYSPMPPQSVPQAPPSGEVLGER